MARRSNGSNTSPTSSTAGSDRVPGSGFGVPGSGSGFEVPGSGFAVRGERLMSKLSPRRWPLLRQLATGTRGNGREVMSDATEHLRPRYDGASVTRSICPYCAVGCGQLVYHRGNDLVSIEGDPESPISAGHLCPKGAASHELLTHANRLTRVKYRAPYATAWQEIGLDRAMEMIA